MQAGETVPREAFVVLYEKAERKTYEAVVSLTDEAVVSFDAHRGRAAAGDHRGVHGLRGGRAGRPGLAGGDAPARGRGLLAGMIDPGRRGTPGRRTTRAAPDRPPADVGALRAGRARLRAAGRGPGRGGRPRRDGGHRGRRPRRRRAPAQARQLRPGADGGPGQRPVVRRRRAADLKPIEITQPEGASFTVAGHGVAWQKWTCGSASRRARASSCTSSPTTGGRSSIAPRWRRCTSPMATRRPRTASRTCSTRASTGSAGSPTRSRSAATASARSTTSTASSTTRTASR